MASGAPCKEPDLERYPSHLPTKISIARYRKLRYFYRVRVISKKPLREFANKHADAKPPLGAWLKLAEHGTFRNLAELKQTFSGVDMVSVKRNEFYVFNIGGNKYRLVAAVHFNTQMLFIRHVLTHAEYSTERWKK